MMFVGKSYRNNQMTCTDIEFRYNQTGNMELLQCHLATFLYFCLIFSVFGILQLVGGTSATIFKFDLCSENPFRCELIVKSQYKTRNRNRIVVLFCISFAVTIETVYSIILEVGHHLSIAAKTEFLITYSIWFCRLYRVHHHAKK